MSKMKDYYVDREYKTVSGLRKLVYQPHVCVVQPWIAYLADGRTVKFSTLTNAEWYFQHVDDPLIINKESYESKAFTSNQTYR